MITITNGRLRASLVPERGALVTSLQLQGREFLYLDAATLADPGKNVRGGIPILFPICGPLGEGTPYTMPQHGLARQACWSVLAQSCEAVELGLRANSNTLKQFPWDFELRFTFSVKDKQGLLIDQCFINHSDSPMPFQTGLHPYFLIERGPVKWDLPVQVWRDNEKPGSPLQTFSGAIPEDWPVLDWEFSVIERDWASLQDIRLHYDQNYCNLVIWHVQDKPFWCLEPWTGPRFAMRDNKDLLVVSPGGAWKTQVRIQLLE